MDTTRLRWFGFILVPLVALGFSNGDGEAILGAIARGGGSTIGAFPFRKSTYFATP